MMDQTSLNTLWDRIAADGRDCDSLVAREGRHEDYLVDLSGGTLWCRSHETNVWRRAAPVRRPVQQAQPTA